MGFTENLGFCNAEANCKYPQRQIHYPLFKVKLRGLKPSDDLWLPSVDQILHLILIFSLKEPRKSVQ